MFVKDWWQNIGLTCGRLTCWASLKANDKEESLHRTRVRASQLKCACASPSRPIRTHPQPHTTWFCRVRARCSWCSMAVSINKEQVVSHEFPSVEHLRDDLRELSGINCRRLMVANRGVCTRWLRSKDLLCRKSLFVYSGRLMSLVCRLWPSTVMKTACVDIATRYVRQRRWQP